MLMIFAGLVVLAFILNTIENAKKSPEQRGAERAQREVTERARGEEAAKARLRSSSEIEGVAACRVAVQDRLKSPSTAKFPFDHRVGVDDANRKAYVTGSVDSQNTFGATLRTEFGCELHHDGTQWNVEKVVFGQR